ncbi:type II toxin-antitoxin system VapB family antitoxin [Rhabdothermincola sp.]|jgi:hypothetical protein|uniref:type II toxin-antitoxin system VapB family antitoxin n=1 Tax=Rhabdothermincola sp. TaxID=2820405 RepID=UPI002FE3DC42
MRTTLAIDDRLLAAAKRLARERGLTLGALVEEALRRELAAEPPLAHRPAIPVFTAGEGLRPGVDATSTRGLLEALDDGLPVEKLR